MSMAQATAAPAEINIGGKLLRISPFTFRTMGEFMRWVQDAYLADCKRLSVILGVEEQKAYLLEAVAKAQKLSMFNMDDPIIQSVGLSPDGVTRLFWYMVRPNHPDMTLDAVAAILDDPTKLQQAFDAWTDLNAPAKTDAEKKGAQSQTASPASP